MVRCSSALRAKSGELGPNSGVRRAGDQIATDGLKQTLLLASKGNLVQSSQRWLPHRVIEGGGGEGKDGEGVGGAKVL